MKYLQSEFTLPVSNGVSQEEWDRIFGNSGKSFTNPGSQFIRWSDKLRSWVPCQEDDGA